MVKHKTMSSCACVLVFLSNVILAIQQGIPQQSNAAPHISPSTGFVRHPGYASSPYHMPVQFGMQPNPYMMMDPDYLDHRMDMAKDMAKQRYAMNLYRQSYQPMGMYPGYPYQQPRQFGHGHHGPGHLLSAPMNTAGGRQGPSPMAQNTPSTSGPKRLSRKKRFVPMMPVPFAPFGGFAPMLGMLRGAAFAGNMAMAGRFAGMRAIAARRNSNGFNQNSGTRGGQSSVSSFNPQSNRRMDNSFNAIDNAVARSTGAQRTAVQQLVPQPLSRPFMTQNIISQPGQQIISDPNWSQQPALTQNLVVDQQNIIDPMGLGGQQQVIMDNGLGGQQQVIVDTGLAVQPVMVDAGVVGQQQVVVDNTLAGQQQQLLDQQAINQQLAAQAGSNQQLDAALQQQFDVQQAGLTGQQPLIAPQSTQQLYNGVGQQMDLLQALNQQTSPQVGLDVLNGQQIIAQQPQSSQQIFNLQPSMNQQVMDQQAINQQALDQQALNQQFLNQQALDQQALNQQPFNQQALGQQALNQQAFNQQALDQQALNQQPFNQQPFNQQTLNQQAMDQQALNQQTFNQQALGQQALNQQTLNQQALDQQALNQQTFNQQALGQQTLNQQALDQQILNQQLAPQNTQQLFNGIGQQIDVQQALNQQTSPQVGLDVLNGQQIIAQQPQSSQQIYNLQPSMNQQVMDQQAINQQALDQQALNQQFLNQQNQQAINQQAFDQQMLNQQATAPQQNAQQLLSQPQSGLDIQIQNAINQQIASQASTNQQVVQNNAIDMLGQVGNSLPSNQQVLVQQQQPSNQQILVQQPGNQQMFIQQPTNQGALQQSSGQQMNAGVLTSLAFPDLFGFNDPGASNQGNALQANQAQTVLPSNGGRPPGPRPPLPSETGQQANIATLDLIANLASLNQRAAPQKNRRFNF